MGFMETSLMRAACGIVLVALSGQNDLEAQSYVPHRLLNPWI